MSLGFDPDSFWTKKPREITAIMEGAAARLEREHNERAWLAWHIAALMRSKKRLPKLESLQVKKSKGRVQQSWQQMMGIMDVFAARSRRNAVALKAMGK